MIAKKFSMEDSRKSNFRSLSNYITSNQQKAHRVLNVAVTNCSSDEVKWAVLEIMAVQQANTRAQSDKTYHLMVSLPHGEKPDVTTLLKIEDEYCKGLGFAEHQRISAIHEDTDHLHIHIAINKIHPQKLTIKEPYYDYLKLGEISQELEITHKLTPTNHERKQTSSQARAVDMEKYSGQESLMNWIKRECGPELEQVGTWHDLHAVAAQHNLEVKQRTTGLVFVSLESGIMVKGSSVSRKLSKGALQKRLGEFEEKAIAEDNVQLRKSYSKPPVIPPDKGLFGSYKFEQGRLKCKRAEALAISRAEKNSKIAKLKEKKRLIRQRLKGLGLGKQKNYAKLQKKIDLEIKKLQQHYKAKRASIHKATKPATWTDWLKMQAKARNLAAIAELRKEGSAALRGNQIHYTAPVALPFNIDNVTKKGTINYLCVGGMVAKDNGESLTLTNNNNDDLLAILKIMADSQQNINATGSREFRNQIVTLVADNNLPLTLIDPVLQNRHISRSQFHAVAQKTLSSQMQSVPVRPRKDKGLSR